MAKRTALAYAPRPVYPRMPAPIVIRTSTTARKPKRSRRRRGGGGGGLTPTSMGAFGLGGAIIGLAESNGVLDKLPSVPLIGRKGLLALGAYYWSKHGGGTIARDIAIAASVLSGYQLGKEGTISGD